MTETTTPSQEIHKDVKKRTVKPVFEKIVIQHLLNHFGSFDKLKPDSNKYWKMGNIIGRIYYYTDPRAELFINAMAANTLVDIQNNNAYFVCANYFSKEEKVFTVYFVQPETIQKLYIDGGATRRGSNNEWHIKIKHTEDCLIFIRKDTEDAVLSVDKNNYYLQFTMTDTEYDELLGVLPKRNISSNEVKPNLKMVITGDHGKKTFKDKSSSVIAILSVLKSNKSLKIEEILSKIASYGVLKQATDDDGDVKSCIAKLVHIGAISVTDDGAYHITDGIEAEVIL